MDTHYIKLSDRETLHFRTLLGGIDFSETVKASNLNRGTLVYKSIIHGSKEDAVDVVRGYLELQDCLILCDKNTRQFFTVKGSSSVTLINVLFQGRSSYYDIVVGDFTIYDAVDSDRPPSKLYLDDSFCEDGRKLRILCLHGDVFDSSSGLSLSDPRVSVTRVPSVLVKCWFFLCRLFTPSSRKREALATLADFPDVIED